MAVTERRLQIGKRGTVTLPASLRKRYNLDAGDGSRESKPHDDLTRAPSEPC